MTYEQALEDFQKEVMTLTYFEYSEHTRICDLCYLCLHELDLHAEGEYWHTPKDRGALLRFIKKWGAKGTEEEGSIDYVAEGKKQYALGNKMKKAGAYI